MHPHTLAQILSINEQLTNDLQQYLYAADGRIGFSALRKSFADVDPVHLIQALADLEERNIISLSARHNAVFEKAKFTTQNLKPLT